MKKPFSQALVSRAWLVLFVTALLITACSDGSDSSAEVTVYEVDVTEQIYVDNSRMTPPTGNFPAQATRTLRSLVFMPEGHGPFPLLIFSHGFGATPETYSALIEQVSAAGFAIVAPAFPLTNGDAPAGPDPVDTQQQPGDVSFLIDTVTEAVASGDAPYYDRVDVARVGTLGHSNGAITTLGLIANSCCKDKRIDAASVLSGTAAPFNNGKYSFSDTAPVLLVHGTADVLVPYESGVDIFNRLTNAKGMLTLNEVGHGTYLVPTGPGFDSTTNTVVDFFHTHLAGDDTAAERLAVEQVYDTEAELHYSASGEASLPLPPPITDRVAAVEPSTSLIDGQTVMVNWRNFSDGTINIVQCSQGGTGGNAVCDFGNAHILTPNPSGEGSLPLTIIVGEVGNGVCDATTDDCVVVVNDSGLSSEDAILRIPISFAE